MAGTSAGAVGHSLRSPPCQPLRGCVAFLTVWWPGSQSQCPKRRRRKVCHRFMAAPRQSCRLLPPYSFGESRSHTGPLGQRPYFLVRAWRGSGRASEWEILLQLFRRVQPARTTQCRQRGNKMSKVLKRLFWIWWFRFLGKSKECVSGMK